MEHQQLPTVSDTASDEGLDDEMNQILMDLNQEFSAEAIGLSQLEANKQKDLSASASSCFGSGDGDDTSEKFVCDTTIPGVARHLRMLGVDIVHDDNWNQSYILYLARTQHRTILTFSMRMQKKIDQILANHAKKKERLEDFKLRLQKVIEEERDNPQHNNSNSINFDKWKDNKEKLQTRIEQFEMDLSDPILSYPYKYYLLKTKGRYNQIREVVDQFKIRYQREKLFTKCASCSGSLRKIQDKSEVRHLLEQNTYDDNDYYSICNNCNQLFWGIHIENQAQKEAVEKAIEFCMEYSYHGE